MNKTLQWISARTIFYPTLWWNMALGRWLKVRNWWDAIDEHVIVGAFPFDVEALAAWSTRARNIVDR
jgi:atypical dual specificity phosphatase